MTNKQARALLLTAAKDAASRDDWKLLVFVAETVVDLERSVATTLGVEFRLTHLGGKFGVPTREAARNVGRQRKSKR